MLVTDTPVSRSLGATFSELIGQPTPPEFQVLPPTLAAPVTGMTKTLQSFVALSKPPPIVTPTLEASVTETETVVASLPRETILEPHGQAIALATTT